MPYVSGSSAASGVIVIDSGHHETSVGAEPIATWVTHVRAKWAERDGLRFVHAHVC